MARREGYTLVLGGGGAKGSYQMGAWRALAEEKVPVQAVSGASVGALNAALIAQGDVDLGDEIWSRIRIDSVVDIPSKLVRDGKITLTREALTDWELITSTWKKGLLLDSSPLKKLVNHYIDEEKIRKSGVDLGVVTISMKTMKPLEIFLQEMEEGLLTDYLLASASFPAFKNAQIKGEKFMDGGFHDNLPFAMMKSRGYRRFIILDISGLGNNRRPDITGTETIYIKNSIDMGGIMNFDPGFLNRYRELGYLDTCRILGKNRGRKYFLAPNRRIEKRLTALLEKPEIREAAEQLGGKPAAGDIRRLLPEEYRGLPDPLLPLAECAALALGLDRVRLYELDDFLSFIWNSRKELESKSPPVKKPHFQDFFGDLGKKIQKINPEKDLTGYSPQEYFKVVEILTGSRKASLEKTALFKLFPELPGAQVFFRLLDLHFGQ